MIVMLVSALRGVICRFCTIYSLRVASIATTNQSCVQLLSIHCQRAHCNTSRSSLSTRTGLLVSRSVCMTRTSRVSNTRRNSTNHHSKQTPQLYQRGLTHKQYWLPHHTSHPARSTHSSEQADALLVLVTLPRRHLIKLLSLHAEHSTELVVVQVALFTLRVHTRRALLSAL